MTYMFKNLNATISKPKEMLDSLTKWIESKKGLGISNKLLWVICGRGLGHLVGCRGILRIL